MAGLWFWKDIIQRMGKRVNRKQITVLFGSFLLVFIGIGVTINTTGVFIEAVSRARGFSLSSVSLIFSIGALVNMGGAILVGHLLNRFDHRPVMAVSILLLGSGMMLYGFCDKIWHFYLVALITGSGTAGSHLIPATMFVTRWFRRRRGMAMGIVLAGNGLGGLVFNPLTQFFIEKNPLEMNYAYKSAYILEGVLVIAVLLPTALLLRLPGVDENPNDKLSGPYGISLPPTPALQNHSTIRAALHTGTYWLIAFMMLGVSAVFMGMNQHLYGHFSLCLGFPQEKASLLIGLMMGMTVPGILIAGITADKVGIRRSLLLFGTGLTGSLFLLLFIDTLLWALGFVLVYGFFNVLQTVYPPLLVGRSFGEAHYPSVFGSLIVAQTLGAAFGPYVIGLVFDRTGSYLPSFIGAALILSASLVFGALASGKETTVLKKTA